MNFSTSECVHCGLCLEACPTYRVTGAEDQSPRGRIHLIRAVEETRLTRDQTASALDACLLCRACETACPSDVPFHTLLAEHREGHSRPLRRLLRWGLTAATPLRFLGGMLRLARRWRILAVVERWGPARLRNLARSGSAFFCSRGRTPVVARRLLVHGQCPRFANRCGRQRRRSPRAMPATVC